MSSEKTEWLNVKRFCEKSLESFRLENDAHMSEIETATLRGKIEFVKEILELGETKKPVLIPSNTYIE